MALAIASTLGGGRTLAADDQRPAAEITTYSTEGGPTYFALSMTPPAGVPATAPREIVILFDTSASQAGPYRETALAALDACLAKLDPSDRVQLMAADLDARPMSPTFVSAGNAELKAAVAALRNEPPLGTTDMEGVLRAAASRFDKERVDNRVLLYIGDGLTNANLLGTDAFRSIVGELTAGRVPVSSYAIGPKTDVRLLASLANHTGGNLYVAEPLTVANEAEKVTEARAKEENLRRGSTVGASMADWAHATVYWPTNVSWPSELAAVYPKNLTPLRSDRDTVAVGTLRGPVERPLNVQAQLVAGGKPVDMTWQATPQNGGDSYAYLSQVVQLAQADDGSTLPSVGSLGLAETGRVLEAGVDGLTDLAERAVATGDTQAAKVAAQAALARDPGNIKAKTVQRVVEKQAIPATPVAQIVPPQPGAASAELPTPAPAPAPAPAGDLNLVRPRAVVPPQAGAAPPAPGALTDRFSEGGALLDEVEQNRRVFGQMLRREVENTVIDARRSMADDPATATQNLKLALQNVERAPELSPELRAQLIDKLQVALREAQHAALIKDELDAEREEGLAAARERRLLNDRMARDRELEKQLVDRFNALVDEKRFDEALDVAATIFDVDPTGVTPVVALVSTELRRNDYLMQVTRAARWTNFFDTMYEVEKSSVPFPDDPPIVYPDAEIWQDLTNRRKDRYGSMDLKATGEAEKNIEKALRSPLHTSGLDFTEQPLNDVISQLQEDYEIPIQLDKTALDTAGVREDEPVSVNLHNVTLRSALKLMLKNLNLTYVIQDEVLMITTPEEAERKLVVKVYPVADLVLPIDASMLGGGMMGGGMMGGGMGGGMGGMGGGMGGMGGGMGGMGGMGGGMGGMGGGGGFFSVPNDAKSTTTSPETKQPAATGKQAKKINAIAIDASQSPAEFWNAYFAGQRADLAAVRETVRQLMAKKQYGQVIALIEAALRNGQPQPWMYESLGIAMQLDGRPKSEIERTIMSAADFSSSADELLYIAQYLTRMGLDRRAMLVCQQVAKIEPLRAEAYALGLRAAERANELSGVRWATVGILSQAWPENMKEVEVTATRVAKATLERLASEGKSDEREAYVRDLENAMVRDCVVHVSWTGNADVDVAVEEPTGTICSSAEPRTTGGGVQLGDAYAAPGKVNDGASESYICPKGFAGRYRVHIRRVWGEVAAGKVTVDVTTHLNTGETQHERQQLELGDQDALVVFDLNHGRRTEPLASAQLAGAIKRQQTISRYVLAQQIASGSDPNVAPPNRFFPPFGGRGAFLGGGAVGFQPIVQTLPEGTMLSASGVVSADRRYVRIAVAPTFSQIGNVQTFTFAGQADPVGGGAGGGGAGGGGAGGGGAGGGGAGGGGAGGGGAGGGGAGGAGF